MLWKTYTDVGSLPLPSVQESDSSTNKCIVKTFHYASSLLELKQMFYIDMEYGTN